MSDLSTGECLLSTESLFTIECFGPAVGGGEKNDEVVALTFVARISMLSYCVRPGLSKEENEVDGTRIKNMDSSGAFDRMNFNHVSSYMKYRIRYNLAKYIMKTRLVVN